MSNKKNDSGSVIKDLLIAGGAIMAGCTMVSLARENKKIVKDYNNLVDKYNSLGNFIKNHDFYKKSGSVNKAVYTNEGKLLVRKGEVKSEKIEDYIDQEGRDIEVTRDKATGIRILSVAKNRDNVKKVEES